MESIFLEGFFLQASLIFALGAQNIFVLESGLRRQHHLTVSLVCFLCDLTLILLGVAGAATFFNEFPGLKLIIGVVGVYFLFTYGLQKLREREIVSLDTKDFGIHSFKRSIILAATFSILNPHAYLDAFVLIGGYASKYTSLEERLVLGLGAAIYSGVWFLILSSLSSYMKPLLLNPQRMRSIMATAGILLVFLSGKLALDVVQWIPSGIFTLLPLKLNLYTAITY